MTVAPSSSANGVPAAEATSLATQQPGHLRVPELDWLGSDLRQRLRLAAEASGSTVAAMCEAWLREGLERFEALQPRDTADGSGRCSLRTGTCTLGPVPLPVQQER